MRCPILDYKICSKSNIKYIRATLACSIAVIGGKKLDSFGRINLYLNCYSLVLPLFCDNLEILANTYRGSLVNTASPGGGAVGTLDANVSRRRKRGSSGSVMLVYCSVFWKS